MPCLSREQLEQIADGVIHQYKTALVPEKHLCYNVDPTELASLLGYTVDYQYLTKDGSVLGKTASGKMWITVYDSDKTEMLYELDDKTILIEKRLLFSPRNVGRKNFTIAHELAHQIINRSFPEQYGVECRVFCDYRRSVKPRKKVVDWHEWQADALAAARLLLPAEPGFYHHFNTRYRETYAQRIPPATGPYRVSRVERGRCIELQRIPRWWGEHLPLCRHRFNADTLEYHFLTGEAQVWEFLLRGKLDALQTRNIAAWQERAEPAEGLIRCVYDAEYPLPPYGIALNTRTLPDMELRRGLLQAMDMDTGMQLIMRGEGQRLRTFHSGYGALTPQHTPQYAYNPAAAREAFARAGYTAAGPDGILRREDGTRLSVTLLYTPHEKISILLAPLIRSAAQCGAEIVPEPVPWQICQRRLQERSHQLVFWAMPAPELPEPERFFSLEAEPAASPFSLNAADMNAALADYRNTPSADNLARIDQLVQEHAVWLPGWKENRVYLIHHPRLRIPASPWCYDALDAHLFWVINQP